MKKNLLHIFLPLLLIALLCAAVPTAFLLSGHEEPLRNAVNTVLTPFRTAGAFIGNQVQRITDYFTEYDNLKEENEHLKEQLASMEEKVRQAEMTLDENEFLSEFLELKENHSDYRFLKCEVVSCDNGGYYTTYTLNVGEQEGAAVGYPVITAQGVVGRITEIGTNWAKVTSITSVSSSVGAYVERSEVEGVAVGDYTASLSGQLTFTYYEEGADIKVGDRIRTSGLSSYYPQGLLLGEVVELRRDTATQALSCLIEPAFDADTLSDVMILTDFAILSDD